MNEIIANGKDINNETFLEYFKYQNPSFLSRIKMRNQQKQLTKD